MNNKTNRTKRRKIRNELDILENIYFTSTSEVVFNNEVEQRTENIIDTNIPDANVNDESNSMLSFIPGLLNDITSEPLQNNTSDQSLLCTNNVLCDDVS